MSTRVKICGLTHPEDAWRAADAGADAMGFVFVPGTPRFVPWDEGARWIRTLPPLVSRVALFVDAPQDVVSRVLDRTGIEVVQFHGDESPEYCQSFRNTVRVLKAFRVRGPETLKELSRYREAADAFLLDAWSAGAHGGTGARFDWDLAVAAREHVAPLVLAGGLNPDNVSEAVRRVRPYAVDVSSGVESSPGRKDPEKVIAFIRAAKLA